MTTDYDFLHIVPPQTAPSFTSSLAAPNGFVDVNINTLRHNKYPNVFALGDVANLPTGKTAAGIFLQAPVVVNNLLKQMENQKLNGTYNGYSSCPMFVGDKKLMMIEFKYDSIPDETFNDNQTEPNYCQYLMKKEVFPRVYFKFMPKGIWYGTNTFFKPQYD